MTLLMILLVLGFGISIGVIFTVMQNKRRERAEVVFTPEKSQEPEDDVLCVRKISSPSSPSTKVSKSAPTLSSAPNKEFSVQILHVMAKKPRRFNGYDLLQTLLSEGLRYGDMKIFHRHQQSNGKGPILFSLASVTEPGTFNMQTIGEFSCPGVTLFMQLSGTPFDDERYALMLETANRLAEELDGVVCDQSFEPFVAES